MSQPKGWRVRHPVLILSLVIAFGIMLGKIKVAGISLGVTWILFVGIVFGHFDLNLDEHLLHFLKEFGLILFVYSIGLQVGPGFFSAFKKGGFTLNVLAVLVVFISVLITVALHFITGIPITTMVGILSGAVTNTPGLGASQQANSDLNGIDAPEIILGRGGHPRCYRRHSGFAGAGESLTHINTRCRGGRTGTGTFAGADRTPRFRGDTKRGGGRQDDKGDKAVAEPCVCHLAYPSP